jgi:hypothetical protein
VVNVEHPDSSSFVSETDFARDPVPEPDSRALADQPLSDLGKSRRLVTRYGQNQRVVGDTRPSWLRWDGWRWIADDAQAAAVDYCHKTADHITVEALALDDDVGVASRLRGGSSKADFATRIAAHRKWATGAGCLHGGLHRQRRRSMMNGADAPVVCSAAMHASAFCAVVMDTGVPRQRRPPI